MLEMGGHRHALVAAGRQHQGRPEGCELLQMLGPVVDRVVENRADQRVLADLAIEAGDQPGEAFLVDTLDAVHGIAPNHVSKVHVF